MSITKLSRESQNFINKISLEGSRSTIVSLAIARVLANGIPLPSTKVDNLNLYFNNSARLEIEQFIYKINELVLIDTKSILNSIIAFYSFRYYNLFPDNTVIAINPTTGIVDYFGISKFFSDEVIEFIKNESSKLTVYNNDFMRLKKELSE